MSDDRAPHCIRHTFAVTPPSVAEFELRRAHAALLTAYMNVLDASSFEVFDLDAVMHGSHGTALGRLLGPLDELLDLVGRRWMTRRLIASHIRRRLSWLSAAYAQSSALAEARDQATFAEWLRRAREATAEFADSLPTWRTPSAFALLAPTIALIGFARGVISYVAFGVLIVLVLVIYLSVPLVFAFRRKRAHFLRPAVEDKNVYQCENDLFELIGRRKPREFQVDAGLAGVWTVVIFAFVVWAVGVDSTWKEGLLGILGFAVLVGATGVHEWYANRWDRGQF